MCGQTSIERITGMSLPGLHEFVPDPDHPTSCVHCHLHPTDLPHWTD